VDARLIAIAVPFFFLAIGIEAFFTRKWADPAYRLYDSLANLSCGIGQQVLGMVLEVVVVGAYFATSKKFALAHWSGVTGWIIAILGVDFAYYWFHRASHRINFIWATHTVHHQSEEYNLSVALRQSWTQQIAVVPFYLPLAVIGVTPAMFITAHTIDTIYQFWIHTRTVKKLGPIEWIFNTPSHHRVHHGINPKYIDKNYAGMLIVWDRMFGTFIEEEEEPTYGTVKPLASYNPTWANVQYWAEIVGISKSAEWFPDKLKAFVAPPEWRPGGNAVIPETSREIQKRYEPHAPRPARFYVIALFVQATLATLGLLVFKEKMQKPLEVGLIALTLWTLTTMSGLVERKKWAPPLEALRLGAILGMALALLPNALIPVAIVSLGMLAWLRFLRPALDSA